MLLQMLQDDAPLPTFPYDGPLPKPEVPEVPLPGTDVSGVKDVDFDVPDATVEGRVQTNGVGWTENVVVRLFRRVNGKRERMGSTRTASDGSYKFSVKGNETEGDFYIQVLKPEGYEFTRTKRCKSNIKINNGKSKYFQVKLEKPIIRDACLQKEPETTAPLTGVIFVDTNGDGVQDADETGLPDVAVSITDSSGYSQTLITDENGAYQTIAAVGRAVIEVDPSTLPPIGSCSDDMAMIEVNPATITVGGGGGNRPVYIHIHCEIVCCPLRIRCTIDAVL